MLKESWGIPEPVPLSKASGSQATPAAPRPWGRRNRHSIACVALSRGLVQLYSRLSLGGCDVGAVSSGRMARCRRCCCLERDEVGSPDSAAWTAAHPPLPRPRRLLRPKHKSWSPGFREQQAARITVFTCRPRPARPLRDTCDFTGSTARTCQKNTSVFASSSHFSLPVTQGPRLAESFPPTRPRRTILPGSRAARKLGRRRRVLNPESPGRRDRACFSSVSRP